MRNLAARAGSRRAWAVGGLAPLPFGHGPGRPEGKSVFVWEAIHVTCPQSSKRANKLKHVWKPRRKAKGEATRHGKPVHRPRDRPPVPTRWSALYELCPSFRHYVCGPLSSQSLSEDQTTLPARSATYSSFWCCASRCVFSAQRRMSTSFNGAAPVGWYGA